MEPYGLHWFRRDLRVAGNSALKWNWKKTQGRTLGVFFFDSKFLSRPDFSHNRFAFFLSTLKALRAELRDLGGDLLVLDHRPEDGFKHLFEALQNTKPVVLTFNRDYEPFARERDARVSRLVENAGVPVHTERDHLLIEPHELHKDADGPSFYQVYSPFCRKWLALIQEERFLERLTQQKEALGYLKKRALGSVIEPMFRLTWSDLFASIQKQPKGAGSTQALHAALPGSRSHFGLSGFPQLEDALDRFIEENQRKVNIPIPESGSLRAFQVLQSFQPQVESYLEKRDYPAISGTSGLSLFLKNGSITPALILAGLGLQDFDFKKKSGPVQFLKEIIWREFYYHILYHRPDVETQAFLPQYRDLKWENRPEWFEAWKEGRTGYPIVDAGMRQLQQTGWMHNRVRMIVASFLTKDLLVDWRWGEKHFMNLLLDGDLAPNNGGWQWAASTGCDPQPYFRIFNPVLQSLKFDPNGDYIRKYVSELNNIHSELIHEPGIHYITPIVEHSVQKERALALYRK